MKYAKLKYAKIIVSWSVCVEFMEEVELVLCMQDIEFE